MNKKRILICLVGLLVVAGGSLYVYMDKKGTSITKGEVVAGEVKNTKSIEESASFNSLDEAEKTNRAQEVMKEYMGKDLNFFDASTAYVEGGKYITKYKPESVGYKDIDKIDYSVYLDNKTGKILGVFACGILGKFDGEVDLNRVTDSAKSFLEKHNIKSNEEDILSDYSTNINNGTIRLDINLEEDNEISLIINLHDYCVIGYTVNN